MFLLKIILLRVPQNELTTIGFSKNMTLKQDVINEIFHSHESRIFLIQLWESENLNRQYYIIVLYFIIILIFI